MSKAREKQDPITVLNVGDVSPHNKAIYEAGKTLLVESIGTARDFCKDMIATCTGAIPVYLGILVFVLPEHYTLGITIGVIIATPAILFLLGSIVFTIGYLPIADKFSLDIIEDIERARDRTISRRSNLIKAGLILFIIAMLLSIVVVVTSLGSR